MAHPLTKFHFIETDELNRIVRQLQTAVTICEQAQSLSLEEHHDRPETSYAGASGWSAGAMRNALITLTHLIDGAKLYGEDEEDVCTTFTTTNLTQSTAVSTEQDVELAR